MTQVRSSLSKVLGCLLFYGGLVYATAPSVIRKLHGNDLWKALYGGRYLALFHQFPHHSTFTYSPVKDFLVRNAFNWFGNLAFMGWYLLGGDVGLQLLRVLVVLVVVGLYHSLVNYNRSPLLLLVLTVFVFGLTQKLILRTALFSVPFTALLFWLWHQAVEKGRSNWLYAVPLLLVVWANTHGSYLVGWGLFGVLTVGRGLEEYVPYLRSRGPVLFKRCLILLLVTFALVSVVKPFPETTLPSQLSGVIERLVVAEDSDDPVPPVDSETASTNSFLRELKSYLGSSLFPEKTFRSAEFKLVFENTQLAFVKANVLILLLFLGTLLASSRTTTTEWLLLVVGAYFGFSYLRTAAYLPLIAMPVVLPRLFSNDAFSWDKKPFVSLMALFVLLAWLGATSALLLTGSARLITGNYYHEFGLGRTARFRGTVPSNVLARYPDQKVGNTYNTGSFLIWSWWPYKKVLIDSKGSAYTDEFWDRIVNGNANQNLIQEGIHLFVAETSNYTVLRSLDSQPGWKRRFRDAGLLFYQYTTPPESSRKETAVLKKNPRSGEAQLQPGPLQRPDDQGELWTTS